MSRSYSLHSRRYTYPLHAKLLFIGAILLVVSTCAWLAFSAPTAKRASESMGVESHARLGDGHIASPETTLSKPATQHNGGSLTNSAVVSSGQLTLTPPAAPTLVRGAAQPGAFVYDDDTGVAPVSYHQPGALLVAGRMNYDDQSFIDAATAGATVLIYMDAVLYDNWGPYHQLLFDASACGPAAAQWPGNRPLNAWGDLADFREGSVVESKLECVLEQIVEDNPHIGGFFADDLGTRPWGAESQYDTWNATEKQEYYDGAVAIAKIFRKVADKYGLFVMVNGTWNAGNGGGYPNTNQHGLSLADGMFVEHHDIGAFWTAYLSSTQWSTESPLTQGEPFHFALPSTETQQALDDWNNSGIVAWTNIQATADYGEAPTPPWGSFHPTGVPNGVTAPGSNTTTGSASYTFDAGQTGAWWQNVNITSSAGTGTIQIQTRTSEDGNSWSAYEAIGPDNAVASPNGQYLQVLITLSGTNSASYPTVSSLSAGYVLGIAAPISPDAASTTPASSASGKK